MIHTDTLLFMYNCTYINTHASSAHACNCKYWEIQHAWWQVINWPCRSLEYWLHKLFIKLKWCDVGKAKIFVLAVLVFPVKCGWWCAQTYWANLIYLNNNENEWLSELCVFAYICDNTVGPRLSKHLCATSMLKVFR